MKKIKFKDGHGRQGDVLIFTEKEYRDLFGDFKIGEEVPRENGKVVLAHGELTGHMHAFSDPHVDFRVLLGNEDRCLHIQDRPATLIHDEHNPIHFPAGRYIVRRQREYRPTAPIRVAD